MSLNTLKYSFLAKIQFMRQTAKYKCEEPQSFHGTQDINSLPNSLTTEINFLKKKLWICPCRLREGVCGEKTYLHSFMTPALDGVVCGQQHASHALSRVRKLGTRLTAEWAPETEWTIWRSEKSFAPAEIRYPGPSNTQPIATTTDYANLAYELALNKLRTSSLKQQLQTKLDDSEKVQDERTYNIWIVQ